MKTLHGIGLLALVFGFACSEEDAAQDEANQGLTQCALPLQYNVNEGPSAGAQLNGFLFMNITESGELQDSVYALGDEREFKVTGTAIGKDLSITIDLGQDGTVVGSGSGTVDISACDPDGGYEGPGTGPQAEDEGDWLACCCPTADDDCGSMRRCLSCREVVDGDGLLDSCGICRRHVGFDCMPVFCP